MSIPDLRTLRREQARPWWLRAARFLAVAALVLYVLYVVVGFWVLPGILRTQMARRGSDALGRKVEIEKVEFNPLKLALQVHGFHLREPDGSDFVTWRRFAVDFEVSSLWSGTWHFHEIALEGLQAKVVIDAQGRFNFADLQARLQANRQPDAPKSDPEEPRPVRMDRLHLDIKPIAFSDFSRTVPFVTALGPVNLNLSDVHTGSDQESGGEVTGVTEAGEHFSWQGSVALKPLSSRGRVTVRDFSLPKHATYLEGRVPFAPVGGLVSLALDYEVSTAAGAWQFAVRNGEFAVKDLALADAGSNLALVHLPEITGAGLAGGSKDHRFRLGSLSVKGGEVDLLRSPTGLNLAKWAGPSAGAKPAPGGPPAGEPYQFALDRFDLQGLGIRFRDTTLPLPAAVRLENLSLSIQNFDTAKLATELPVRFRAALAPQGVLSAEGQVALAPLQGRLQLTAEGLALAPLSPYLEAKVPFQLTEGQLSLSSEAAFALPPGGAPAVGAKASVSVADFALRRTDTDDALVRWRRLELTGIEWVSQPEARLVVGRVVLSQPEVAVIVGADRALNWSVPPAPAAVPAPPATSPSAPLSVAVDRVDLESGRISFEDRSLTPRVQVSLADFHGFLGGLSSAQVARADVDLAGRFDGGAPFAIKGQVNPLSDDVFSDLTLSLQGLDLLPASPYSGKFVGRSLARGNASLDMKVRLSRRTLAVNQTLILDQLTLGEKVESPDATKLPVSLALALLRDARGRITLPIPVEGSLDDPKFRVGAVVWGVVKNLLEKAATAPFALLGSMFGGGGDELGWVEFLPGSTELTERATGKMETVARALRERPALNLDIVAAFDGDKDRASLREKALQVRLQRLFWDEQRRLNPQAAATPAEAQVLDSANETRLLTQLYRTEGPLPGETPAAVESSPESPAAKPEELGVLARFVRFLAGSDKKPSEATPPRRLVVKRPNLVAAPAGPPAVLPPLPEPAVMRAALLARIEVSDEALQGLADDRAQAVRAALVEKGQVAPDRVFLVPSRPGSTRAELSLK